MTKARIISICFQAMAAFWAVIVIMKAHTTNRWSAYLIAAVGVVVISAVGTRLKHRHQKREKADGAAAAPMSATPHK